MSGQDRSTLFALTGITKTYGGITALDNLSVQVPHGATGLLGPNGSGKTTMIRTLLGLVRPDAGAGNVFGLDILKQQLILQRYKSSSNLTRRADRALWRCSP